MKPFGMKLELIDEYKLPQIWRKMALYTAIPIKRVVGGSIIYKLYLPMICLNFILQVMRHYFGNQNLLWEPVLFDVSPFPFNLYIYKTLVTKEWMAGTPTGWVGSIYPYFILYIYPYILTRFVCQPSHVINSMLWFTQMCLNPSFPRHLYALHPSKIKRLIQPPFK